MATSNALRLALGTSCLTLVLSVVGSLIAFQAHYLNREVAVKSIEALAPLDVQHTLRFVAPRLASTADSEFVQGLIRSRHQEATMVHTAWLQYAESQQRQLQTQFISWLVVTLASLVTSICLYRVQRAL